ncbi:hypothetical protein [Variovorax sp. MHTC-1]|uniref:hypothetical protein n=1 Tax=Variovorax sp. MHTC-1 TaxID=2495593 RepID=UPI000F86DE40|nr:hypothetical protein [Variovorax sp. MHTC-1]RST47892.1 hypothetical protein EJI01_27610 [Variovorax sp. MHTC-1]
MTAPRLLEALFRVRRSPPDAPAMPVPAPPVEPAPVVEVPALEETAGAKTMRSLEEVRADLARLRQTASERHALAQQPERPADTSFARTDFMDIPEPLPTSSPRETDDSEFEATAFADVAYPIPLLAR